MRAFTVLVLLGLLLVIFVTSSFANVDLTPYNGSTPQTNYAATPITPMNFQAATPTPTVTGPSVQVQSGGQNCANLPLTGGCTAATPAVPVTGGCPAPSVPVNGTCVYYYPYPYYPSVPVTGAVCPNPYMVQYGDTLSRIAQRCGTSVGALLALNPNFQYNPNLIYPGQTLWLYPVTGIPQTGGGGVSPTVVVPVNPVTLNPSIVQIPAGSTLNVTVLNFPANTPVSIGVGRQGVGYQVVNRGITDAEGTLRTTIVVPAALDPQQAWRVAVVTTTAPIVQYLSPPFYITGSNN